MKEINFDAINEMLQSRLCGAAQVFAPQYNGIRILLSSQMNPP